MYFLQSIIFAFDAVITPSLTERTLGSNAVIECIVIYIQLVRQC